MMTSASSWFRGTALAFVATLGLTACTSNSPDDVPTDTAEDTFDTPEAPAATEQETALAETLEADFEVTDAQTLEEQWPDITALAAALSGTSDPDVCQQAGAEQYELIIDEQPPTVRAAFDPDAFLDEHASGETVTVFFGDDETTAPQLHEAHQNTDTACVEDESGIQHETTQSEAEGRSIEIHTWEVVASGQLTGRMIDVVSSDLFVRYAAAYPPQVIAEDLEADAATEFNEAATERALEVFDAAVAQ